MICPCTKISVCAAAPTSQVSSDEEKRSLRDCCHPPSRRRRRHEGRALFQPRRRILHLRLPSAVPGSVLTSPRHRSCNMKWYVRGVTCASRGEPRIKVSESAQTTAQTSSDSCRQRFQTTTTTVLGAWHAGAESLPVALKAMRAARGQPRNRLVSELLPRRAPVALRRRHHLRAPRHPARHAPRLRAARARRRSRVPRPPGQELRALVRRGALG